MALLPSGVPALLNGFNAFVGTVIEVDSVINQLFELFGDTQSSWGIYEKDLNAIALEFDGFVEFGVDNSSQIAGYRIEEGQFASYNKVDSPYEVVLTGVKTGTINEIDAFLRKLDSISNDIKLYSIVTKGQIYNNANMLRYSYRRSPESGLNILYITMVFVQIQSTDEVQFNVPTKTQAGQKIVDNGTASTAPLPPQTPIVATPI